MSSLNEISYFISSKNYLAAISLAASLAKSMKKEFEFAELNKAMRGIPHSAWDEWCTRKIRVAVSSGTTIRHLTKMFDLYFKLAQVKAEFFFCEYDLEGDCLNPSPDLQKFSPEIFVMHPSFENIKNWPELSLYEQGYQSTIDNEVEQFIVYAQKIQSRLKCKVILDNFTGYPYSSLGSGEFSSYGGRQRYIQDLNRALRSARRSWLEVHDLEGLSSFFGLKNWYDDRMWTQARVEMTSLAAQKYIQSLAGLVGSGLGLIKKCLVLDLDNTLWGGVIGDLGTEGIRLGNTTGEGQAFVAFQKYCLDLKKQGTLLAISSKNDFEVAIEPFRNLTEMIIREDHVDEFKISWQAKSESLKQIAEALNIGLDSLVFFDDNPAERMEVLTHCPSVFVVDVPEDVALYRAALDQAKSFQNSALTEEDLNRSQQYQQKKNYANLEKSSADFGTFLQSLNMKIILSKFQRQDLGRISQLINKTNQFNLTTRRYTDADCERFMLDPHYFCFTVRMSDRFSDHGLISVVILRIEEGFAFIDSWLMSCRVLKRGVEDVVMQVLQERLQAVGIDELRGEYIPTAKNGMVSDLLEKYGFEKYRSANLAVGNSYRKKLPLDLRSHCISYSWN